MSSSSLLSATTLIYCIASVFYISSWVFRKDRIGFIATWVLIGGCIGNIAGIGMRWIESYQMGIGHAPLSNLYESLVFFSLMTAIVYLFIEYKYKNRLLGAIATPIAFLAITYASLSPNINDTINPLIPALKSNWLIAHVLTCFMGYSGFAVACGAGLLYIMKSDTTKSREGMLSRFPDLMVLDELIYQTIVFGFLFLSIGIITGAVWANTAWGSYWSWDPKETWSLITWFIYAMILHVRTMRGWHGKSIAYLSLLGFSAVLFTYFGVNYLPGLHSYGQ